MRVRELFEARANLAEAIKKNCPRNFETMLRRELRLLRGDTGRGQIEDWPNKWWFESKPRTTPRKSQTENNIAMVWTTQHDSWADVPRRAFSNSCTTSYEAAAHFGGSVYLIIPFDNVQSYAYSPIDFNYYQHVPTGRTRSPDMLSRLGYFYNIQDAANRLWESDQEENLESLQKILRKHKAAVVREMSDYTNIEQIWKFSDLVNDLMEFFAGAPKAEHTKLEEELKDYILEYIDDFGMPPASWLKKYVNPKAMNVKVYDDLDALPKDKNNDPEIWFEGQFIAITDPHDEMWVDVPFESEYFKDLTKRVLG